jgi:hypothetical protein
MYYCAQRVRAKDGPPEKQADHFFKYKSDPLVSLEEGAVRLDIANKEKGHKPDWLELLKSKTLIPPGGNPIVSYVDILTLPRVGPTRLLREFEQLRDTKAFKVWERQHIWPGYTDIEPERGWGVRQPCFVEATGHNAYFSIRCEPGVLWFDEGERLLKKLVTWARRSC